MEKVTVPTSPGRLINAVAAIGYDPEVALCDLMDNSIDAQCACLNVHLVPEPQDEEGEADTIHEYIIADDGIGMDRDVVINAFTLGGTRAYPPGSLGKFGLGLKSAGLSLGRQIVIMTKTKPAAEPICALLSVSEVEASGRYEIDLGAPPKEHLERWEEFAPNKSHGTVVVLRQLTENQPSFSRFQEYLRRYCSVVFHMFMDHKERPIRVSINGKDLKSADPLFFGEARANGPLPYDPIGWSGKTPHILVDDTEIALGAGVNCTVAATHLVHPPSFETENRRAEVRDSYMIEIDPYTRRQRHGFYVYRNRRVIVMAERFYGLIPNQQASWAFRGRLMFDERADSLLSLDVKKRHCQLPREARANLQSLIAAYVANSADAWKVAGARERQRAKASSATIANEGIATAPVTDLAYAPGAELASEKDVANRKQRQGEIGDATAAAVQDPAVSKDALEKHAAEKAAVVEVQGLRANAMWLPYASVVLGKAETIVNRAHTWNAEALAAGEDDPRIKVILYQFFMILARAELEVRSANWHDASEAVVTATLERFRRKASAIGEDLAEALSLDLRKLANGDSGAE
jgi:hypothetical protein